MTTLYPLKYNRAIKIIFVKITLLTENKFYRKKIAEKMYDR